MKRTQKTPQKEIEQAKENLADLNERGADAVGGNVLEFMESILTPDEIVESELRVSIIGELIKARQEKGISQKTGRIKRVKQPVMARMEKGSTSAVGYYFEGIGPFREDAGGCSIGNGKQIKIPQFTFEPYYAILHSC